MRAVELQQVGNEKATLRVVDAPVPRPAPNELLLKVSVCGVCRTDLDLLEQRLLAPKYPVIPGHQVVGSVAEVGDNVSRDRIGKRVGVAWINSACGQCRYCRSGYENLCPSFQGTGCDANGGYAEYVNVRADFTHLIPEHVSDAEAAPLLCAGAIGWRSLRLANVPDGEPLGLTGFGASAHLVLQLARGLIPNSPVYVFARDAEARSFAMQLGAAWAGDTDDEPPQRTAAIIDTTPAWKPVVSALQWLQPGGRLVINAIRKAPGDEDELLRINYGTHLWMEREIKSVANVTRADVRECLQAAAALNLRPTVTEMPLESAAAALQMVKSGVRGAVVLRV